MLALWGPGAAPHDRAGGRPDRAADGGRGGPPPAADRGRGDRGDPDDRTGSAAATGPLADGGLVPARPSAGTGRGRRGTRRRGSGADVRQNPDQQTTSERDALGQYLDYQRETILLKTEGLTRQQLGQKIPTSDLTLAGILYHLALNEEAWFEVDFLGRPERDEWRGIDWEADPNYEFRTALTREPEWLRRRYLDACDCARQAAASADSLDQLSADTRIDGN